MIGAILTLFFAAAVFLVVIGEPVGATIFAVGTGIATCILTLWRRIEMVFRRIELLTTANVTAGREMAKYKNDPRVNEACAVVRRLLKVMSVHSADQRAEHEMAVRWLDKTEPQKPKEPENQTFTMGDEETKPKGDADAKPV